MPNHLHSHDDDIPHYEPWLGVTASVVIPVITALFVHSSALIPLIIVATVLFLTGLWMLRRQTARRHSDQQGRAMRAPTRYSESEGL